MICTNCGNEVPNSANVCGHCGHRLKMVSPTPPSGRGLPGWVWGVGGMLFVLILAGVLLATEVIALPGSWAATQTPVVQPFSVPMIPVSTLTPVPVSTFMFTPSPTNTLTPTINPDIGSTWIRPADGMVMLYVPAGVFTMGSDVYDEKPVQSLYAFSFWIDQTEVTNGKYAKCVENGACQMPDKVKSFIHFIYYGDPQFDNYPVVYISWNAAVTYCQWAGARLPNEAEWEKAARGTDGRTYPWGVSIDQALIDSKWNYQDTTEVGSFPNEASPYGALDMAGNVMEWVNSLYRPYPFNTSDGREDLSSGGKRVLRGGSWLATEFTLRTTTREDMDPEISNVAYGFRCAASVTP